MIRDKSAIQSGGALNSESLLNMASLCNLPFHQRIPTPGGTNCDKQVLTALGTSLAGWPLMGSSEA